MDFRRRYYHSIVNAYDYCLYAERIGNNVIAVFRKHASRLGPNQFVLAITDNWQANGRFVEWGEQPLLARLHAMDSMKNPTLFEDIVESYHERENSETKDRKNSFEAMAAEMYPAFKKTFSQINTTGLKKKTRRMEMEH